MMRLRWLVSIAISHRPVDMVRQPKLGRLPGLFRLLIMRRGWGNTILMYRTSYRPFKAWEISVKLRLGLVSRGLGISIPTSVLYRPLPKAICLLAIRFR